MNAKRLAILLIAACGLSVWQVTQIPESPMYAVVGATLIPGVVAALFSFLALLYALSALRGNAPDTALEPNETPLPRATQRAGFFIGGCLLFVLLIKPLGFLLSGTVAGLGIARAFDAPLNFRSVVICTLITLSFWLLFAVLLGVELGPLVIGL